MELNVSPHISHAEATVTSTGLPNHPGPKEYEAMQRLARNIFEPLREKFGPIKINSFYRSSAVNKAVGGSKTSQHVKGEAIDIAAPLGSKFTNRDLFRYIRANLPYDQLIWEMGTTINPAWVHVSYVPQGRRQVMVARRDRNGKTIYLPVHVNSPL